MRIRVLEWRAPPAWKTHANPSSFSRDDADPQRVNERARGWTGYRRGIAFRAARTRMRAQGIPEQDFAFAGERCGCEAGARSDAGVLWLLRLALVCAWSLVARACGTAIPGFGGSKGCESRSHAKSDTQEYRRRSRVSGRRGA